MIRKALKATFELEVEVELAKDASGPDEIRIRQVTEKAVEVGIEKAREEMSYLFYSSDAFQRAVRNFKFVEKK